MVRPTLWGPPLWQALFSSAWHADSCQWELLQHVVFLDVPALLPCEKCRAHFHRAVPILRRSVKDPTTPSQVFEWLYLLKDRVNRTLGQKSTITLVELRERYTFHAGVVDDVALGDAIVLMALYAHEHGNDDRFIEFCVRLGSLLPLPSDSQLIHALSHMRRPVATEAWRAARGARVERGLPLLSLPHYRNKL